MNKQISSQTSPPSNILPFACQNCLHERQSPANVCSFCQEQGTVILKKQIAFFASGENKPKPKLLYCRRCSFKTIHQLRDCPRCTRGLKGVLYGQHLSRLTTKKSGNNFEIVVGFILILFGLLGIPFVLLVFYLNKVTPKNNIEMLLIMAISGGVILFGFIVLTKGIIGRIKGGN